jgi:para-aminobenzoate synthetase/4-amino-4-deoxychorismate lyase
MESMLLNNGKYFLFGRHLKRLARSAAYFGVPVNTGEAIKLLRTYASKLNKQSYKVRLLVDAAGRMRI